MQLLHRGPERLIRQADASRDRKDWVAAAANYRRALDLDPGLSGIWVQYGHALKESGQLPEAEAAYRRALSIEPDNADTHLQLGHVRKIQGDIEGAAECYRDALRHDPTMADPARELDALGLRRADPPPAAVIPADELSRRIVVIETQLTPLVHHVGTLLAHLASNRALHFETRHLADRLAAVERSQAQDSENVCERVASLEASIAATRAHLPAILLHVATMKAQGFELARQVEATRKAERRVDEISGRLTAMEEAQRAAMAGLEANRALRADLNEVRAAQSALTGRVTEALTGMAERSSVAAAQAAVDDLRAAYLAFASHITETLPGLASQSSVEAQNQQLRADVAAAHGAAVAASRSGIAALEARLAALLPSFADRGEIEAVAAKLDALPSRDMLGRAVAGLRAEVGATLAPLLAAQLEESRQLAAEHSDLAIAEARLADIERFRQDAAAMLAYLDGRVEFVRRELMYEFHHGARANHNFGAALLTEPVIRDPTKIAQALAEGARVNVGCGHLLAPGYLNVDRRDLPGVDVIAEADAMPFPPDSLAEIRSSHLLEHFPQEALLRTTLPHWKSLLRPGGRLLAIVPDGQAMLDGHAAGTYPFSDFREVLFGAQDYAGDYHRNLLTPASLENMLHAVGFINIRLVERGRRNGKCFEFEIEGTRP